MMYRREIDGLRALAVLAVILFHAGFETFSGGFVGVDVFFVISGYLITTIILEELQKGKFSIVNFYERRARRILPALFLVIGVCMPFAWFLLLPSDMKDFSQSIIAVSVFASNILFWRESGYFGGAADLKPLVHTWSLAVEEQYYVLLPLFLILFWRFGRQLILFLLGLIFVASIALAQWAVYEKPDAAFYLLPTRVWELLIGSFIAFYLIRTNRNEFGIIVGEFGGWLGLILILFAIFVYSKTTPFPSFYALAPTLGTALIIVFATQKTSIGKLIGNKAFVAVGLISYSAYLWHQPLFSFARHGSLKELNQTTFLLLSVFALVLAWLTWRFVEIPFRGKIVKSKIFFRIVLSFIFVLMGFGIVGNFSSGFKFRFGGEFDRFIFAQEDINPRRSECHFSTEIFPLPHNYCILGKGKVRGLLLGDSHADALSYSLSEALLIRSMAIKSVTYSGCPPIENIYRVDQKDQHKCYQINKQSFDYASANPDIEYIILFARWSLYLEGDKINNSDSVVLEDIVAVDVIEDNVKERNIERLRKNKVALTYIKSVQRLLEVGKKVILIYPVPEFGYHVPKRLARLKQHGINESITIPYEVYVKRHQHVIDAFNTILNHENLTIVRPDQLFCETIKGGECFTTIENDILYYDDDHLSNTGAKYISKEVVRAIEKMTP